MEEQKKFRVAIRVPEVFYVLRDHESCEPDRFIAEAELIQKHQSNEDYEEPVSKEIQLGRDQVNAICRTLQSEFTTEIKNISSFKSYIHNLESSTRETAVEEVKILLQEMRSIEKEYKGDNISNYFLNHWVGEDLYFILQSIDLAGTRIVRDSRLLEGLSDEQKIGLYLETY